MQEGREGSGVEEMGQRIFGRRDLERVQYCDVEMQTKAYNMMRNEDSSENESAPAVYSQTQIIPVPIYNSHI